MDDLIVIILTLVIVVVGAIGQIKKKNLPQPEGKSQNSPTDFWSLLTGTEEVMAENQTAEIIEPEAIPGKEETRRIYSFEAESEGITELNKSTIFEQEIKPDKKEEREEKITKSFSLKKAVIYSEILNRKYS